MAGIKTTIELQDKFTDKMNRITEAANRGAQAVGDMENRLNQGMDPSLMTGMIGALNRATASLDRLTGSADKLEPAIRENTEAQGQFNREVERGTGSADGLLSKITGVAGAYLGFRQVKGWIDECTEAMNVQLNSENQLASVLKNVADFDQVPEFIVGIDDSLALNEMGELVSRVDGTVVDVTPEMRTDYLYGQFDRIREKASEIQGKGIYGDEAMIGAAAEFATYMSDTDAITSMMDTLADYAMGMSGGGEIAAEEMVNYATNLGKIMSGSYDAMTKKGFEFTDAQKAVIDGSATEAQYIETLGEDYLNMSEDMRAATVINDIIAESWDGLYESMSDTPEGKIIQMNNAIGDMKEMVGAQLYPAIIDIVDTVVNNSGQIQGVMQAAAGGLAFIIEILSYVLAGASAVFGFVQDNWPVIGPIIMGIVGALTAYYGAQLAANAISALSAGAHIAMAAAQMAHAAVTGVLTAATAAEIAAQNGLNASMAACPLVWIIGLVLIVIGLIYAAATAIARATGVADTGLGVIAGALNVALQFFLNLGQGAIDVLEAIGAGSDAIGNNIEAAFNNAIANVISFFWNLMAVATRVISGIAEGLNRLPFVEIDTAGISGAADDYAAKAQAAQDKKMEYQSVGDAVAESWSNHKAFQKGWASEAFANGSKAGDSLANTIGDKLGGLIPEPYEFDPAFNGAGSAAEAIESTGLGAAMKDTAGNTGEMAKKLSDTADDLSLLRDIAEREVIDRTVFSRIELNVGGISNTVNNNQDLDEVGAYLVRTLQEQMASGMEGVGAVG